MRFWKTALVLAALLLSYAIGFASAGLFEQQVAGQTKSGLHSLPLEQKFESAIAIVAVKQQGQAGIVNKASVEIIPGKGRVLFALNPFVEPDTQQSAETAAMVAQQFSGKSLADRDVIYSIENTEAKLVGGPSAGAALTVATIAALEGKKVRDDAVITGTIMPNGSIGPIGGVIEKAAACAEAGKRLFLVPKGQGTVTYYERRVSEERKGFITIKRINYIPKKIDLNDLAKEQGWNLQIREVSNISEAANILLE